MYRIGLDLSGGDRAPQEIFKGAFLASKEIEDRVILIGSKSDFDSQLKIHNLSGDYFEFVDAPEKILMEDSAASSVHRKKTSSIAVGSMLLKEKKIDAFVSCGNTGACVSAAVLYNGLIDGVERPGIALIIPTKRDSLSIIIDVGANINPKPIHLFQYGIMASVYYRVVFGKENPTVGILNIGEEESKGPEYLKFVHKFFASSSINFIGNVEGKDIFSGKCDCIICDGYAGNIALKVTEGVVDVVGRFLISEIKKNILGKIGLLFVANSLKKLKKKIDYSEYGGAPLLGIDGIVIIGHGRSNAIAVKNAIKVAVRELKHNLNLEIKNSIDLICKDTKIKELALKSNNL